MKYVVSINEEGLVLINGEVIREEVFNKELVNYTLVNREDFCETLIGWISEADRARSADKALMINDLKYLFKLKDEYLFSSILTNEYVAESDNEEEFCDVCEEILNTNKKVV